MELNVVLQNGNIIFDEEGRVCLSDVEGNIVFVDPEQLPQDFLQDGPQQAAVAAVECERGGGGAMRAVSGGRAGLSAATLPTKAAAAAAVLPTKAAAAAAALPTKATAAAAALPTKAAAAAAARQDLLHHQGTATDGPQQAAVAAVECERGGGGAMRAVSGGRAGLSAATLLTKATAAAAALPTKATAAAAALPTKATAAAAALPTKATAAAAALPTKATAAAAALPTKAAAAAAARQDLLHHQGTATGNIVFVDPEQLRQDSLQDGPQQAAVAAVECERGGGGAMRAVSGGRAGLSAATLPTKATAAAAALPTKATAAAAALPTKATAAAAALPTKATAAAAALPTKATAAAAALPTKATAAAAALPTKATAAAAALPTKAAAAAAARQDLLHHQGTATGNIVFVDPEQLRQDSLQDDVRAKWSRSETLGLIQLYKEYKYMFESNTIKNSEAWRIIAQELGSRFSPKQCEAKFKHLKQLYVKKKDNMGPNSSGAQTVVFDFFDEFDEIFSAEPNIVPLALAASIYTEDQNAQVHTENENNVTINENQSDDSVSLEAISEHAAEPRPRQGSRPPKRRRTRLEAAIERFEKGLDQRERAREMRHAQYMAWQEQFTQKMLQFMERLLDKV